MLKSRSHPESFCQTLLVRLFNVFNGPICQIIQKKQSAPMKPLLITAMMLPNLKKMG